MELSSLLVSLAAVALAPSLPTLELGAPAPAGALSTGRILIVSPAQTQQERTWEHEGVTYSLGVDDDALVQYISTSSPSVMTLEGAHVGETLEELRINQHVEVTLWPAWGYVAELPSGWKAATFLEGRFLERQPQPSDRVELLFKGTGAGYGAGHPKEVNCGDEAQ
jgi:hypothetical protein